MKRIIVLFTFLIVSSTLFSQVKNIEARINKDCITQPATLNIGKGQIATDFKIENINSGYNCYNGGILKDKGLSIKNSAGNIVYSTTSGKELKDLKLPSGIYKIYVDGGRGAYLKLKFMLKSI